MLYEELGGKRKREQVVPDTEASREFLSNLWDNPIQHNESAEWLKQVEQVLRKLKQGHSFGEEKPRLNHLLFMDDLKSYGSSESGINSLVRTTK